MTYIHLCREFGIILTKYFQHFNLPLTDSTTQRILVSNLEELLSSTVCCFCPLFRKTGISVLIPRSSKNSKESLKPYQRRHHQLDGRFQRLVSSILSIWQLFCLDRCNILHPVGSSSTGLWFSGEQYLFMIAHTNDTYSLMK